MPQSSRSFCPVGSKHSRTHFCVPVLVTFSLQKQLKEGRKEGFILAYSFGGDMVHYSGEVMEEETWTHCIYSQEAKGDNQVLSSLFCLSGAPVQGIVLHTFRMGLPFPAKYFWKHPHRCTQRYVYLAVLNSSKLTMKSNYHRWVEFLFCALP